MNISESFMSKITFLPQGYQAPKSSNGYMKFQDGENKFRILSQPILGWEDWHDKKPVRYRMEEKPLKSLDPKKPIKHFWAMIVWNYAEEEIQILEITQATLRKSLESLCQDEDWGAPYFYDLKVIKTGEGMETEYVLNPIPHKNLPDHIKECFNQKKCNLEALFYGEDPFSKEHNMFTSGIFDQEAVQSTEIMKIDISQAEELNMILGDCSPEFRQWMYGMLKKQYNITKLIDIPLDALGKIMPCAVENMEKTRMAQMGDRNKIDVDAPISALGGF